MMNRKEIKQWLNDMNIHNYHIHANLVVDVHENISFYNQPIHEIPFQLGSVKGEVVIDNCRFDTLNNVGLPFECDEFYANNNRLLSLEGCPKARKICVNHNKLQDFKGLPPDCRVLEISFNQIDSLTYMPEHNKLISLDVSGNPIKELYGLKPGITKLIANECLLENTWDIPSSVIVLHLNHNPIKKLEDLPSELSELHVNHCKLVSLDNLPKSLTNLHAQHNYITEFSAFKDFDNAFSDLISFDCSHNPIESLEFIPLSQSITLNHCGLTDRHLKDSKMCAIYLNLTNNHFVCPVFPVESSTLEGLNLINNPIEHVSGIKKIHYELGVSINNLSELLAYREIEFKSCIAQDNHQIKTIYTYEQFLQIIQAIELQQNLEKKLNPSSMIGQKRKI